jgi:hypothetical protein
MTNLHDLIEAILSGRVWGPTFQRKIKDDFPEQSEWLLKSACNAVCFDIGKSDDIPDLALIPDLMRMPYPVTWMESRLRDGLLGLLACEVGDGILNVGVFNKAMGVAWQLVCVVEVFADETSTLRCRGLVMVSGEKEKNDSDLRYAARAISIMARFIMALNCKNTKLTEHPAPKFMNKKRAANGKQPIFSFWTLHLPGIDHKYGHVTSGKKSGPRLHLRRGHIRQYAPGKYAWVEACIVGNKQNGIVAKDYAV